jgi:Protein of unknown function (DUF3037)
VGPKHCGCAKRIVWYSYATIRLVPRVEREEFINVGVVVFAREQQFLAARIDVDRERLSALAPSIDLDLVERHLRTFLDICAGDPRGGPLAALPAPERFHWLVAPRSTIIQTSAVHVGRSDHPERALGELLEELVRQPARRQDPADSIGA